MKSVFSLLFLATGLFSGLEAANVQNFNEAAFENAQKEGKLTAVKFHASWCGNCKAQSAAIEALTNEVPELKNIQILHADFDNTKDLQKQMGVNGRTIIVLFKNGQEVDRISTKNKAKIKAQLLAAL